MSMCVAAISEYPRPSGRDAAVTKVMEAILTGQPHTFLGKLVRSLPM